MHELERWDTFYVIVGSAAAALIGLQFVVITLVAERPVARMADATAAFATPTIVHFAAAFVLSAIVRAPWETLTVVAALWGLIGMLGLVYSVIVGRRMRKQSVYTPELEDWLFYFLLPMATYILLIGAPIFARSHTRDVLFLVGVATLLLVLIGIHNSWDAVTYHVSSNAEKSPQKTRGRS
jgi:hypothetical protein